MFVLFFSTFLLLCCQASDYISDMFITGWLRGPLIFQHSSPQVWWTITNTLISELSRDGRCIASQAVLRTLVWLKIYRVPPRTGLWLKLESLAVFICQFSREKASFSLERDGDANKQAAKEKQTHTRYFLALSLFWSCPVACINIWKNKQSFFILSFFCSLIIHLHKSKAKQQSNSVPGHFLRHLVLSLIIIPVCHRVKRLRTWKTRPANLSYLSLRFERHKRRRVFCHGWCLSPPDKNLLRTDNGGRNKARA